MEQNQKDPKMEEIIQIMESQEELTSEEKAEVLRREIQAIEEEILKKYPYAAFADGTVLNVNLDEIEEEIFEEYGKKWRSLERLKR
jgi:hypothetical protein